MFMKILIISDIHANCTALEAVLNAAGEVDATWCLGDLVGYGPDPNECIERIRALPNLACITGNHDSATINEIDVLSFNPEARLAIQWTQEQLTPDNRIFLTVLPEVKVMEDVTLVHGSPRQPVWEYLLDTRTATLNFDFFDTPFCFVGHTHLPVLYVMPEDVPHARLLIPENTTQLALAPRVILNPGSVGQPRDRDPRAAYAIFDASSYTVTFFRVDYDIAAVQERMLAAHMPERHIRRLEAGW